MKTNKICMIVRTDIINDARVDREAKTLAAAGYKVEVINLGEGSKRGDVLYSIKKAFGKPKPGASIISVIFRYLMFVLSSLYYGLKAKAHIYHAHDLSAVIPAYLAARIRRAKYIYDAHEIWEKKEKSLIKTLIRRIELFFAKKADTIISANKERAIIINDELKPKNYPVVISNYLSFADVIRTDYLGKYLSQYGLRDKMIVLYQGVIKIGRSYEAVIRATEYFRDDVVVVFVGGALSREYYKHLIELRNKVNKNKIFFHPLVPKEELLNITASAQVGLILYENTGRNNYYCAPNKLYEYMMCGIPVITSDFPALKMIENEKIGIRIDPKSPKQIAEAVNMLIEKKELYSEFSLNAKRLVKEKYNWEKESQKLIEMYKKYI